MRMFVLKGMAAISLGALAVPLGAQDTITQGAGSADELNAQSRPAPPNTTIIPSRDPAVPDAVVTNHPGNMVAVPPTNLNKTYPVCTARLQDNCQNPGEGGAPGRSRALPYWPGEPASER